jgi:drug/metabolite transporter (DMT)-like permease
VSTTSASPSPVPFFAFTCLIAGGCAIAFAPVLVRLSHTGPVASAFWRVALAAPILWAWVVSTDRGRLHVPVLLPIGAGLFFAADLGVWHWSITLTSIANATLLANLAPIFVALAGRLFFHEALTRTLLAGMIVAMSGMLILASPNFALGGARVAGDALGALTAVFYAGYMLTIKAARGAGLSTARIMAWSTSWSAAALLPMALLFPQPVAPRDAGDWTVLVGLALISQILGQGLIAYALAHLPATLSSVSLLVQPVMAAYLAWQLLGERIGVAQFVGGGIVLAGIAIARRGGNAGAT